MTLLEEQLVFYGSYHSNKWNQLIHFICVPIIFWTALAMSSFLGTLFASPSFIPEDLRVFFQFNTGFFVVVVYAVWYIVLEPFAGVLSSFLLVGAWISSNYIMSYQTNGFLLALAVHVVCWILQFIGHGVAEGRKPALFDSLVQAIVTAPFFVWIEFLFYIGYRPQLYKTVEHRVKEQIRLLNLNEEKKFR